MTENSKPCNQEGEYHETLDHSDKFSHLLPKFLSQNNCQNPFDNDDSGESNHNNSVIMCNIMYSHINTNP